MAEIYFPFDAGNGANVQEAQWRQMARHWRETGVLPDEGDELLVTESAAPGMKVDISTGSMWIRGHFYENDAEIADRALAAADPVNPRIDRIVVRVDFGNNTVSVEVLTGTAAATPTAPALTQSSSTWEEPLARISVPAADTAVTDSQITDERQYSLLSGDPIGKEVDFMATSAPKGYVALDGVDKNRFTYYRLFDEVGTTYGAGDGSTTFGIRDAQGRVTVGLAAAGHADVNALTDNDGVALANRSPKHRTSMTDPTHSHNIPTNDGGGVGGPFIEQDALSQTDTRTTAAASTGITVGPGGSYPIDTPAYGVALRCVRAR